MKKLYVQVCTYFILLTSTLYSPKAFPQSWMWASRIGSTSEDWTDGMVTDVSGNIFITGTCGKAVTGLGLKSGSYIAKYDSMGTVLWAQNIFASGIARTLGITSDGNNVYVTGFFYAPSVTIGSTKLTTNGADDIFIAKYSPSGMLLWAANAGSSGADQPFAISADTAGNTYLIGDHNGATMTFGNLSFPMGNNFGFFIAKYDALGNAQWAKKMGAINGNLGCSYYGITTTGSDVYVTGHFAGTADFDAITLSSIGQYDIFLAKYDASGTVMWATSAGGIGNESGNDVTTDASGNVYITGEFDVTVNFGSVQLTNNTGKKDIFIAKYDPYGSVQWAQSAGSSDADYSAGIAVHGDIICIAGTFFGPSIAFGATSPLTNTGGSSAFLSAFNGSGTAIWSNKAGGGTASYDWGTSIAADAFGNVYVSGTFDSTSSFGNGIVLAPVGMDDAFIARYGNGGIVPLSERVIERVTETVSVYPNPFQDHLACTFHSSLNGMATVNMLDVLGKKILNTTTNVVAGANTLQLDVAGLPSGVYVLQIITGPTSEQVLVQHFTK